MHEFKQYHQEDKTFVRETKVYFSQCNQYHVMTLAQLLDLTSVTASEDFVQRGLTFGVLVENKSVLLVSRNSFKIHRMPRMDDVITVKTWEEKAIGLQFSRRYQIIKDDGTVLVDGDSTWLSVNPDTRRIQKPSDFKLRPAPTQTTEFCGTPAGKIQPSENLQRVSERIIRFSDIDANGHVNNARYATYIADILPETFLKKPITNFRINYAHEAKYGEKMELWADFNNEDKIFVVGKNQDGICFEREICY